MADAVNINEKTVFALLPDGVGGNPAPIMIVGTQIPAFDERMVTFDLSMVGFPSKLVIFGPATHHEAMKAILTLSKTVIIGSEKAG